MVVLKICQAQANLYAASGTNFSVHHYLQLSMGPRSSHDFCFWKFRKLTSETSKPSIHCLVQQIPWHLREAWSITLFHGM